MTITREQGNKEKKTKNNPFKGRAQKLSNKSADQGQKRG